MRPKGASSSKDTLNSNVEHECMGGHAATDTLLLQGPRDTSQKVTALSFSESTAVPVLTPHRLSSRIG